jgi:hypothetical protein
MEGLKGSGLNSKLTDLNEEKMGGLSRFARLEIKIGNSNFPLRRRPA